MALKFVFKSIIAVFTGLLHIFIRLNASFIDCFANNNDRGCDNHEPSYYKIAHCYSFIFFFLTMLIFWIKECVSIICESIDVKMEYFHNINDKQSFDAKGPISLSDHDITVDKKMESYNWITLLNCSVKVVTMMLDLIFEWIYDVKHDA